MTNEETRTESQPIATPAKAKSKTKNGGAKRPVSDRKRAANRSNALFSKGPTTPEGKAKSSRNSYKHGYCANHVDVPGEDPKLYEERFDVWRGELNPQKESTNDYLVALAVRKSLTLDRIHVERTARTAERVRNAGKTRATAQAEEIEAAMRLFATDPDVAVRTLKSTVAGLELLIEEWTVMRSPLVSPRSGTSPTPRGSSSSRATSALGHKTPAAIMRPSLWIQTYREVARKLELNRDPEGLNYNDKYHYPNQHRRDLDRIDDLQAQSREGIKWIHIVIDTELAKLRACWKSAAPRRLTTWRRPACARSSTRATWDGSPTATSRTTARPLQAAGHPQGRARPCGSDDASHC